MTGIGIVVASASIALLVSAFVIYAVRDLRSPGVYETRTDVRTKLGSQDGDNWRCSSCDSPMVVLRTAMIDGQEQPVCSRFPRC